MLSRPVDLISARSAADLVDRSLSSVRSWVRTGQVTGYRQNPDRLNSALCVSQAEVLRYAEGIGVDIPATALNAAPAAAPSEVTVLAEEAVEIPVPTPAAPTLVVAPPQPEPEPQATKEFRSRRVSARFNEYAVEAEMSSVAYRLQILTGQQATSADPTDILVVERQYDRVRFDRVASREELSTLPLLTAAQTDGEYLTDEAVLSFSNSLSLETTKGRIEDQLKELVESFALEDLGRPMGTQVVEATR